MSISGIKSQFNPMESVIKKPAEAGGIDGLKSGQSSGIKSFGEMLGQSMKEISGLEQQADLQIEGLVTGKPGVTTHGAMIALEKADTAFQLMNTIRSKIIRVYEEILRTSI